MNLIDILDLYALQNDSSDLFLLFKDYHLDSRIEKDKMNRIIVKDLGTLCPCTTDPTMFKFMVEEWFNKWNYNITKLIDTMYYEYDPLTNKNIYREEDETDTRDDDTSNTRTDNLTRTDDLTNKTNGTDTVNTSAYDSSAYQPRTQEIKDNTIKDTGTVKNTGTVGNEGTLDRTDTIDLDVHEYGKEGNSSYQELIQQERDLAEFNIFEWIIKQMRKELFLLVY